MLALEAFKATAKYDWTIQNYFEDKFHAFVNFPETINLRYRKIMDLRYGENPHQRAALYKHMDTDETNVINSRQLAGKRLSWTNILDLSTALELVKDFEKPCVTIIKHMSPCGAACGSTIFDAYEKAYSSDPISAYGGVVGANRKIDFETAKRMAPAHFDCIIASDFDEAAVELLKQRKALRLLKTGPFSEVKRNHVDMAKVAGGLMIQEHNTTNVNDLKVVTEVKPTPEQIDSLKFAWKVVKHVKSNGIVLAKGKRTVGIGLGQTSRVEAVKTAIYKSKEDAKGSVLASDGFFPFRDSIDKAGEAGVTGIIQPGGSKRDQEVIDACNEHKISMIFTGIRCFRH
jgi:phosphoribosylaminoimidazolecarboxamide formyltransferase/IMP cyclohydrolase